MEEEVPLEACAPCHTETQLSTLAEVGVARNAYEQTLTGMPSSVQVTMGLQQVAPLREHLGALATRMETDMTVAQLVSRG